MEYHGGRIYSLALVSSNGQGKVSLTEMPTTFLIGPQLPYWSSPTTGVARIKGTRSIRGPRSTDSQRHRQALVCNIRKLVHDHKWHQSVDKHTSRPTGLSRVTIVTWPPPWRITVETCSACLETAAGMKQNRKTMYAQEVPGRCINYWVQHTVHINVCITYIYVYM